jgi:CheY-like chemotaxis protein
MGKILIIEDDPLVARMYQKVMGFEGMEVEVAENGLDGLKKAKEIKPVLILCDVMMPKLNGIEVLEHLKADKELKDIPVIMLTNLSGTQDAQAALSRGAVAYLVKSEHKPKEVAEFARSKLTQNG